MVTEQLPINRHDYRNATNKHSWLQNGYQWTHMITEHATNKHIYATKLLINICTVVQCTLFKYIWTKLQILCSNIFCTNYKYWYSDNKTFAQNYKHLSNKLLINIGTVVQCTLFKYILNKITSINKYLYSGTVYIV